MNANFANASIYLLDKWIKNIYTLNHVENLEDLSFKQLNDLLFYKNFPQFKKHIENSKNGDDFRLLEYELIANKSPFKEFSVHNYFEIVTNRLETLPEFKLLNLCDPCAVDALFQNLIMVAFTVERWGQFLLKNLPGDSVKSIQFNRMNLDGFIKKKIPNYNTLGSFAITSISEVEGVTYKIPKQNVLQTHKVTSYSAYSSYDINTSQSPNRFPSILKLDDFPLLIKKGELLAQAYNHCLLELMELLKTHHLKDQLVLDTVTEITQLFKIGIQLYRDFLKSPYFNEAKFIYILRQHTVELSQSPATIILEDFKLSSQEKSRFKGFLDHYLSRQFLNLKERNLFVKQILKNEGIINPFLETYLNLFSEKLDSSALDIILHQDEFNKGNDLLKFLLKELLTKSIIGEYRIRYAMTLLKEIAPEHSILIQQKLDSENWAKDILAKIKNTPYFLPPSGANSIAYYGPDVILGNSPKIPNYNIHMINRVNVMLAIDQERFWHFEPFKSNNLEVLLTQELSLMKISIHGNLSADQIKEHLLENPWLATYIALFDSFSLLTSTHDGIIEKYIRKLGKKMPSKEKKQLVSNPDHGTTYMQPEANTEKKFTLDLPSLNLIAEIRRNHLFKNWVRPLKKLNNEKILTNEMLSQQNIIKRTKHVFFNRKSRLIRT